MNFLIRLIRKNTGLYVFLYIWFWPFYYGSQFYPLESGVLNFSWNEFKFIIAMLAAVAATFAISAIEGGLKD
jgi:hypothetical protein